jgi:guanylate kinase
MRGRPISRAQKTGRVLMPGVLFVVSGPSGVGKSSILAEVRKSVDFFFSVSMTTRDRRPHEVEGVHYRFVDRETFERAVETGELLEWAEYGGNLYGTPKAPVLDALARGEHVLFDIENQGAQQIRDAYDDAVLVFVLPPSLEELESRLRRRGDTSEEDVGRRLAVAEYQIATAADLYDFQVVNDSIATAAAEMVSILMSAHSHDCA